MAIMGSVASRPAAGSGGLVKTYMGSSMHQAGMRGVKDMVGLSGKGLGRLIGPAFTLMAAAQGYQEGGVSGAAMGAASEIGTFYAFNAALSAMGTSAAVIGAGVGLAAGAGLGAFYASGGETKQLFRPFTNEYLKKHARLEMGTPVLDRFGTMSTMRQRSFQALQNSKINGRSALGNEALMSYSPYYR